MKAYISEIYINKVSDLLVHFALSFTIIQLICPFYQNWEFLRPDLFALAFLLILFIYDISVKGISFIIDLCIPFIHKNLRLILLCGMYFIWDTINLIYANDLTILIDKYLIWGKISTLCFFILYYIIRDGGEVSKKIRMKHLVVNLGITSCMVSLISYFGYYTELFTCYDRLLSTILDHNYFASGIMFGFVGLCYMILFSEKINVNKKVILICLVFCICFPAMYLSGSRRTIIMLWVFLCWYVGYSLFYLIRIHKIGVKIILLILISILISSGICFTHIKYYEDFSKQRNLEHIMDNPKKYGYAKGIDHFTESIMTGNALEVRKIIWESTLEWYDCLSPVQKIIGGGASFHYDIFNDIDNPKNKNVVNYYNITSSNVNWMYPHNFLLEDLMTGGLIKVCIVILIMIEVLRQNLIDIRKGKGQYSILILTMYAVLLGNLLMGAKFGLFGNRFTWIIISLDCAIKEDNELCS